MNDDLIARNRIAAQAIYLATEEVIADAASAIFKANIAALESQAKEIADLIHKNEQLMNFAADETTRRDKEIERLKTLVLRLANAGGVILSPTALAGKEPDDG